MNSKALIYLPELLSELERKLNARIVGEPRKIAISDIVSDSRNVKTGRIFVAIKGTNNNGHHFIDDAVNMGAEAIVVQENEPLPNIAVSTAIVPDTREALTVLMRTIVGEIPSRLFAVTGTNGKTTTTHILRHIISETGELAGVIGTLGYAFEDGKLQKMAITTPGAEQLWRLLAKMRQRKIDTVAIEASSHGLHQKRIWGLHFDVAIFTNLTQDHLDYHRDMDSYLDAKCIMFNELPHSSLALVNIDDPCSDRIISANNGRLMTYAIDNRSADITAEPLSMDIHGSNIILRSPWGTFDMRISLPGRFNIYNAAAAISAALECGYDTDTIVGAISSFKGAKGRFQQVELGQSFAVIIDYAHTPDALRNLILATKELSNGKIIIVFGAGGDRDNSKRPIMGKIAAQYADIVIVTSDNRRSENPMKIIRMIEKGISENKRHLTIPDRREAIFEAIRIAHDEDIVLIAGKGHEDYQIFKDTTIHFDDVEVAEEAIGNSL